MRVVAALLLAVGAMAQTYRVQTGGVIKQIDSEDYVSGVVTGEGGSLTSDEALRALAIAVRTYAAHTQGRHKSDGFDFCDTTHCQRYGPASARAKRITGETFGQWIWFHGKPAFTPYSRSCGGRTEDVSAIWPDIYAPYLTAHDDPYCRSEWTWSASKQNIRTALLQAGLRVPGDLQSVAVVRRTASGRAQMLALDGQLCSASAFRFALGRFIGWNTVRSDQYSIETLGKAVVFHGAGEGHGVGMCQRGADQMGLSGRSFREILTFYYPGTSLRPNDLKWTPLSGNGVTLFANGNSDHRRMLGQAEASLRYWRERLPWHGPSNIDIYLYPDLDSFRNITGEPGWVAARTGGNKIELQPKADSRALEHELVHVLVESGAKPGLPVWFREGLVEHLTGSSNLEGDSPADDGDLRQRTDSVRARTAYRSSQAKVEKLVRTYGEGTVLSWVARGLPAELKYSNNKNPAVSSK